MSLSLCPCGSTISHADCCEPYLSGKAIAPTALALMRSRYTAYTQGNIDYLINTLHPKSRQSDDRRLLRQNCQYMAWVKLTIVTTKKGQTTDKTGMVEFVAEYRDTQAPGFEATIVQQLHERSRFVQENNQWFYVDGDILVPV